MLEMKLENWAVVGHNPYLAPELQYQQLQGTVFDHPRFADGTFITTSAVAGVEDGRIRTKSGSLYTLGEVNPEYEAEFPNARERILNPK